MTYRTSRNSTFNADSHRPTASAARNASRTNTGSSSTCGPGRTRYQNISTTSTPNAMAKSISPVMTAAMGMTSRGK